jgi:hypothetical protein
LNAISAASIFRLDCNRLGSPIFRAFPPHAAPGVRQGPPARYSRERADALARERLLDFVLSYQESGREVLKVPFVDKEDPQTPGEGFDALLRHMQEANEVAKTLRAHLRDYPRGAADGAEDLILCNVRD